MHRLAQRRDERLGRCVGRRSGGPHEPRHRGHVQDAAPSGRDHCDRSDVGEAMDGDDVDVDDGGLALEIQFVERALMSESGIVDQEVDRRRRVAQPILDARHAACVGEVGHHHLTCHVDLGGELHESRLVARHDHQLGPVGGELSGDLPPDPRRSTGHQRTSPRSHCEQCRGRMDRTRTAADCRWTSGQGASGTPLARRAVRELAPGTTTNLRNAASGVPAVT